MRPELLWLLTGLVWVGGLLLSIAIVRSGAHHDRELEDDHG